MRPADALAFAATALRGTPLRTALMLLAMAIGVAAIILLTALGEGARRYVVGQFSRLGSHLIIVLPGRNETQGGPPPLLAETPRDLTLDDALALARLPAVQRAAPVSLGSAPVAHGGRVREVTVIGSTPAIFPVRHLKLARGRPLPTIPPDREAPMAVLGGHLAHELFGPRSALGEWVRIGDRRFRVIGVLTDQGEALGLDLGDMALIPVASAQALFDTRSLFRILIQARSRSAIPAAEAAIRATLRTRHEGEDDVTIVTQDALLGTFDRILRALTYGVAGIGAVSLAVAGILVMNIMLVSVSRRIAEIGLLKALGATRRQVLVLFLLEAALLATGGGIAGLVLARLGLWVLQRLLPAFPLAAPPWAAPAALAMALGAGLLFGLLPARRAADLDPVQALEGAH